MPKPRSDGELIAFFRKGDPMAFQEVHKLHYKTLCSFAANLIKDPQQAEELVSDAFIILFRRYQNFDTLINIRAFLYITVRNACFNAIRRNKQLTKAQKELLYLMQNEADHQEFDDIEFTVLEKVFAEIDQLPPQCQKVVKLIYLERMTTTQIAEQMGLSRNTIQNHKIRAVKLLRIAFLKKKLLSTFILYGSFNRISPYLAGLAGWLGIS
jgi:RNA polymerase sigma-70 factor (family 1)